uniref:Short-chain dehydrogenase/reductase SDR n=1 Tax=Heterorhabditis bacteriophora TaxID=37862 RepID=A0A1I7WAP2_HETBA
MGCDATRLIIQLCDMSSFESIRECAKAILKVLTGYVIVEEDHIDVLVNNAGVMFYPKYEKTVDGHEVTWQCNYLGKLSVGPCFAFPCPSNSSNFLIAVYTTTIWSF